MRPAAMLLALCCLLTLSAAGQTRRKSAPRKAAPQASAPAATVRTKVAAGRYLLSSSSQGILQTWEEPWTLYRTKTGFEVDEWWKASRQGSANSVNIEVRLVLATGLHPIEAHIGSAATDNQLNCFMAMSEFRCQVMGKESVLPMLGAYNFFLPSPWFLTSIVRRAPKKPDTIVTVKLVQMAGMTPNGPKLVEASAQVTYVGEDVVELQGAKIAASIYELRGTESPAIVVWLSSEGVVLAMQDVSKSDQRMELVEFTKFVPF